MKGVGICPLKSKLCLLKIVLAHELASNAYKLYKAVVGHGVGMQAFKFF